MRLSLLPCTTSNLLSYNDRKRICHKGILNLQSEFYSSPICGMGWKAFRFAIASSNGMKNHHPFFSSCTLKFRDRGAPDEIHTNLYSNIDFKHECINYKSQLSDPLCKVDTIWEDVKKIYGTVKPSYDIQRVLIIDKMTRFETMIHAGNSESYIISRFPGAYKTHQIHRSCVELLESMLQSRFGVHTMKIKAQSVGCSALAISGAAFQPDIIISAGGDGTFLEAAAMIPSGKTDGSPWIWLVGINTDPERSEGRLCLRRTSEDRNIFDIDFSKCDQKEYISSTLDALFTHSTLRPLCLQRIRMKIIDSEDHTLINQCYTLNDVLIAHQHCAHSLYAEMAVDDSEPTRYKNSGIIISSGAGSTAWAYNSSKVHQSTVEKVIEEYVKFNSKESKVSLRSISPIEIARNTNKSLLLHPSLPLMRYVLREPIENRIFRPQKYSGLARRAVVKPLATDTIVCTDGVHTKPLQINMEAHMCVDRSDIIWSLM